MSKKDAGTLTTEMTHHGVFGFPRCEKYSLDIQKAGDNSTKVTLKLYKYTPEVDLKSGTTLMKPQSKDTVNSKAEDFLEKIKKRLQTGK